MGRELLLGMAAFSEVADAMKPKDLTLLQQVGRTNPGPPGGARTIHEILSRLGVTVDKAHIPMDIIERLSPDAVVDK